MVLTKGDVIDIEDYANRIHNIDVKNFVFNYLLKNDFAQNPVKLIKEYLPVFLSHHMYYPTIRKVCKDNWNDELSYIFLSSFFNYQWTNIDIQMFEEYIDFYAQILTKEQLVKFEEQRDKFINPLIRRIYNIWLESNELQ